MNGKASSMKKWMLPLALALSLTVPAVASAEGELNWIEGSGQQVELGDGLAQLKLGSGYVMLNADDTRAFQKSNGGVPNGSEIGSVFPADNDSWAVFFDYDDVGHISDEDKNSIDAKELLKSYKEGTEEANKERGEADWLFVDGWENEPHYDEKLHNLTWTLRAHDNDQETIINDNVRLLTREGYISAVLVSDPEHLAAAREQMEAEVLSVFTIQEGKRYEDYVEGKDKKSNYGLAALVVGGASLAVAKKVGLLALLVVGIKKFGVILIAALAGAWRWMRGKKQQAAARTVEQENRPAEQAGLAEAQPGPDPSINRDTPSL